MFYKDGRRSLSHIHLLEFMFWSMSNVEVQCCYWNDWQNILLQGCFSLQYHALNCPRFGDKNLKLIIFLCVFQLFQVPSRATSIPLGNLSNKKGIAQPFHRLLFFFLYFFFLLSLPKISMLWWCLHKQRWDKQLRK